MIRGDELVVKYYKSNVNYIKGCMVHLSKLRLFFVSTILLVTAGCAHKQAKTTSLQNAVSTNQTVAESYDSGKERVIKITSQIWRSM